MHSSIQNSLIRFFENNADKNSIKYAFLFGSYARGNVHEESDIDIAVIFSKDYSEDTQFRVIEKLSLDIEKELHKEINMLVITDDFKKPMLYYNAIVLGVPLYFENENELYELRFRAISEMEDFLIFGLKWQLEVAQRNLG